MKIKDIYNFIDSFAPFSSQCEWDNSGLLYGNPETEIKKIGFALDATNEVIDEAAKEGCNLIVVHHPVIFHSIAKIEFNSPVEKLIKFNIAVICAHTCLDKSDEGVNFVLSKKLGLKNIRRFNTEGEAQMCFIGETDRINSEEFAEHVSKTLGTKVKFNAVNKPIKSVAVCGGSAGEFMYDLTKAGIDAFVTGEVKHHEFIDSDRLGITTIEAGHFETEYPVIPELYNKIKEKTNTDCILLNQKTPAIFTEV